MSMLEENCDYRVDIKNDSFREFEFEPRMISLRDGVLKSGGFRIQNFELYSQDQEEKWQTLVENNKQLRENIDTKGGELLKQKSRYENFKKDQVLLSQEIKDTHEAFLMAKKYYKKFLNMYYTIESKSDEEQTIFVQFFTETKKDSENYSLRLLRNTKSGHYELLETKPTISISDELRVQLKEQDLPDTLCFIREAFLKLQKKQ